MRDEKRRVYQLNLGKSSYVSEDLPVKSLYLNKCNKKRNLNEFVNFYRNSKIQYGG